MTLTQYYYLVASLPLLLRDDTPPFSSQSWLDSCREQVSADDHALLARIAISVPDARPGDHKLWQAYSAWESALRNELAEQRSQRLGLSAVPFLRHAPYYTGMAVAVKDALGSGNPKAVEAALDRLRWLYLEELEAGTQFDLGRLIVYRLKLMLLERKGQLRPETGRASFDQIYKQVLENAATETTAPDRQSDSEKA